MNSIDRHYMFNLKPHHHETLASYTSRLLAANFEQQNHLRHLIRLVSANNPFATPEEAWITVIEGKTGRDVRYLDASKHRGVLHADGTSCRECGRHMETRTACTRCTRGTTVTQHPHFDGNVCRKHNRWVGPTTRAPQQVTVPTEVVQADNRLRKLQRQGRADAPLYFALRNLLAPLEPELTWTAAEVAIYPRLVAIAGIITDTQFGQRFFDPARTFADAYDHLTASVRPVIGDREDIVGALWLYFRATFLSIRESVETGTLYAPTIVHEFPLRPSVLSAFSAPTSPRQPFADYLDVEGRASRATLGRDKLIAPVPPLTSGSALRYPAVPTICEMGHRGSHRVGLPTLRSVGEPGVCRVCNHDDLLAGFNDLATTHPDLASEFSNKNHPLTASTVFAGTHKMLWWNCPLGHEFEATGSNRSSANSGCPVCLHRVIIPGVNDIPTEYPHLVDEFHPTKNINHRLEYLAPGNNEVLWWKCRNGHAFRATLGKRTRGSTCHFCERRSTNRRTIAAARPDLAAEWHPSNYPLTAEDVTIGSNRNIAWLCPKGHTYTQRPERRNAGYGCAICSARKLERGVNDALTRYPDICSEWHPTKNCFKEPSDIVPGTALHWWLCKSASHVTQQSVPHRVLSGGCTECPRDQRAAA